MKLLYKTLYYKGNPDAEYQYRGGGKWYKRKKGSKGGWYAVESDKLSVLNDAFAGEKMFFNYSRTAIVGGALLIGAAAYFMVKRFGLLPITKTTVK